jgi:hypothetical protein
MEAAVEEIMKYREIFNRRRIIRISIFVTILSLLVIVFILGFPSWRLFGIGKMTWAPLFYIIMFGLIILIAVVWRCPVCNGLLGDVFSTKFCSKCGFKFFE